MDQRKSIGGGLVAALLLVLVWVSLNPPLPHLPTSDIFTHLSVARHLVRGEGFLTDVAYPLSFAFDFARSLPQPLIHRSPGMALLLLPAVSLGGEDPQAILDATRGTQLLWLGLLAGIGAHALARRGAAAGIAAWIILLVMGKLLGYAVHWSFSELPVTLLLLGLWVRRRELPATGPGLTDGLLAGALVLLRWDLFWVPILWWLWDRAEHRARTQRESATRPPWLGRGLILAILVTVLVNLPWLVRNARVCGSPFFSLQGQAELVKDTRDFPGYRVYQGLDPQPTALVLKESPQPVLRKFVRGLDFHFRHLGRLLPWALLAPMALSLMVYLVGGMTRRPCPFRPDAEHPMGTDPETSPTGPLVVLSFTLVLLIVQYSFFDHSLRHLLVLFPLVVWEGAWLLAQLARAVLPSPRAVFPAVAVAGLLVALTTQGLPGWQQAEDESRRRGPELEASGRSLREDPATVPFVTTSAAPFFADRAAIWDPGDQETRVRILQLVNDK